MTMYKSQQVWHSNPENKKRKQETWLRWTKANPEKRAAIQKRSYLKRKAAAETQP